MKKSLLLLSLLVSANIFSVNPHIPQNKFDELEGKTTSYGPHRKAGETHAEYLNANGGSLPVVAAHQTGEQSHLNNALTVKHGKHGKQQAGNVTRSRTRSERRAAKRAERQARNAKRSATHATHATTHAN